ncbi:MAG: CHRD domain-containing protein [Solirubrobacterales bacterium]|nr:CHRD domain-containing protein [Solirubrobacterales bacterium]
MSSKLITPVVLTAAVGLAGCGGSSSRSKSHASAPKTGVRGHIYRVSLTGKAETPPGPPNGAGSAVIALHSSLKVCWRFSHLHGFTDATFAHIHRGGAGTGGPIVIPLSTTGKLQHKGCVPTSAAMIKAIEHDPTRYYVNIHSKQYPAGAVRAQL